MGYKVNNLIYAAGPELIGTLRMGLTLTEPVNAQILNHALAKAARRFPYYSVKLVRSGSVYRMEPSDLPFVLSSNGRALTPFYHGRKRPVPIPENDPVLLSVRTASEQIFGMSVTVQISTGGVYEDQ